MTARLEIRLKEDLPDAEGKGILRKAKEYFGLKADNIRVIRVLTMDADLSDKDLEQIRTDIFTNPVTDVSSFSPMARNFDWLIWVGFRPGVRDTAGSTAAEAIEDLFGKKLAPGQAVYTSKIVEIKGNLSRDMVDKIA